jgi:hypothetical protein
MTGETLTPLFLDASLGRLPLWLLGVDGLTCSLAVFSTSGWNTCWANSSVVISVGCFAFSMVILMIIDLVEQIERFGTDKQCRRTLEHLRSLIAVSSIVTHAATSSLPQLVLFSTILACH